VGTEILFIDRFSNLTSGDAAIHIAHNARALARSGAHGQLPTHQPRAVIHDVQSKPALSRPAKSPPVIFDDQANRSITGC
jgi:hypothetical protein